MNNINEISKDIDVKKYLGYIIELTIINNVKNLLEDTSYKINDSILNINTIKKYYNNIKNPIKKPKDTQNKMIKYRYGLRDIKYLVRSMYIYLFSYKNRVAGKSIYDVILKKHKKNKYDNIKLILNDNEFILEAAYDKILEDVIKRHIDKDKYDLELTRSTNNENVRLKLKTKLNYDSNKILDKNANIRNIVFIFNVLHRFIKLYNEEISVIEGDEYEGNEDKAHRTIFLATNYKNKLNLFFYNPNGTSQVLPIYYHIKEILESSKTKKVNEKEVIIHNISMYIDNVSCPIGFQMSSGDNIGYCMVYSIFWLHNTIDIYNNIIRFNHINKINKNNNIEIEINFNWIKTISNILEHIDDYIYIKDDTEKTGKRPINKDEMFNIIINYAIKLHDKVIEYMSEEEQKKFFNYIKGVEELSDNEFTTRYDKREIFIKDKFMPKVERNIPERIDDMELIDNERLYEYNLLKKVTNGTYNKKCKEHNQCLSELLYCDKFVDDEGKIDNFGRCEIKKKLKLNYIGENCTKNSECILNNCNSDICRLNTDMSNLKKIKDKKYLEYLE